MPITPHPAISYPASARPESVVAGDRYRITVLTSGLVRLEWSPTGAFEDRPSTFAIHRDLPVPDFTVERSEAGIVLVTEKLRLVYDEREFSTHGLRIEVLGGVTNYHSVWRYGSAAANPARELWPDQRAAVPHKFGNLGGTARTLDEADGAVPLEDGVLGNEGFAVLDDSTSMLFTEDGWYAPRRAGEIDLYVFAHGHDAPAALADLYAISGKPPVLPRWALGNWWSRYHRYSADEYRELLDDFAARRIPFAVAVLDMDWHVTDPAPRFGSGWTGYSWNRELFPDPETFLAELHDRGLRVTLNLHPADGVRAFEDAYPAMCAALGIDPDSEQPIAFDVTDREFLAAYFDVLHRGLEDQGVDFWWVDWQSGPFSELPGVDPLWVLNHFHFLDSSRPDPDGRATRRPLTFSRYAGPGSHRYPVGFSGDSLITWASLAYQPYFTATAANIGYGWWSHDIGGHMFGVRDDELATRWVQLGVFSPILRLHSSASPFAGKEPWNFEQPYQQIMAHFLRLRHRLVPYLHTMNHRAATAGEPLVRPLYHEQWDAASLTHPRQFHFGTELLVAPVTEPIDPVLRRSRVPVHLPAGRWVDVFTGDAYDGGRSLTMFRPIDRLPVLLRAGGIVPLGAADADPQRLDNPPALEVLVAAGASGEFMLLEDDDSGDGLDPSRWARTPIRFDAQAGTITIGPVEGNADCVPEVRSWEVTLLGFGDVDRVDCSADVTAQVRRHARGTTIELGGVRADREIVLSAPGLATTGGTDSATRIVDLLNTARIAYALKDRILAAYQEDPATVLTALPGMDASFPPGTEQDYARVGESLVTAMTEILQAERPSERP